MGVRSRSSWPRGVPVTMPLVISVGKIPGAMALTEMPSCAHSTSEAAG